MLDHVTLRGVNGRLVWGYRTAAELPTWAIQVGKPGVSRIQGLRKERGDWTLTARLAKVDRFQVLQRPLLFYAPRREGGGHWCWPVRQLDVGEQTLVAHLGPPEH
jgi:hypothetical protein